MARNLFEYHPVIGYRFIPGLAARVPHEGGGYLIRCNQAGFRCDHEVTPGRREGVFRIIVFGCSYTAGEGVSNGKRFSDLLEKRLAGTEVLNFGLPASGTDQQWLAFREYAESIEYDLLLLCPMVSNIWRNPVGEQMTMGAIDGRIVRRSKPYFRLVDGELRLENQPVPRDVRPVEAAERTGEARTGGLKRVVHAAYRRWPEAKGLMQRLRRVQSPIEYIDPENADWRLMKAILSCWMRQSRAPVVLCPIPTFENVNKFISPNPWLERYGELAAAEGAELVNVLPEFWKLPAAERRKCRYGSDDHPTERGHAVLADALAGSLSKNLEAWRCERV